MMEEDGAELMKENERRQQIVGSPIERNGWKIGKLRKEANGNRGAFVWLWRKREQLFRWEVEGIGSESREWDEREWTDSSQLEKKDQEVRFRGGG
jgi:hypothetical protein